MTQHINVPESISREDYLALIRSVGFDPEELTDLRFGGDGIYAETWARGADGKVLIDGGEPVKNTIYIPVLDAVQEFERSVRERAEE